MTQVESMTAAARMAPKAQLTVIRGTLAPGSAFPLESADVVVGRTGEDGKAEASAQARLDSDLAESHFIGFPNDDAVSPLHARFVFTGNALFVEDLGSHNGTYLRVRRAVPLSSGDQFMAGEQILRFLLPDDLNGQSAEHGEVLFCGTPTRPWKFRLDHVLAGGVLGGQRLVNRRSITIGREDTELAFPDDPFISGKHCRIAEKDGTFYLVDLESSNGTFHKIRTHKQLALQPGDFLFLGRQLVRIEAM